MAKDSKYFIVGLFVLVGFVGLAGFFIWSSGRGDDRPVSRYIVYYTDPVSGLKKGASVQYRGITVGKVLDVRLSATQKDLIKVYIEVESRTPVRMNTTATLSMAGITGLVYIDLSTEVIDTQPPREVAGEPYPVVNGSGVQLAKVFQKVPEILAEVQEMAEKMNEFLSKEHLGSLDKTIQNVEEITGSIALLASEANVVQIGEILNNIRSIATELEDMSQQVNTVLSQQNIDQVNNALKDFSEVSIQTKTLVTKFNSTASEIETATRNLNAIMAQNSGNIEEFTRNGLREITDTVRDARQTIDEIKNLTEDIKKNPSQIIFKPTPSGVRIEK